MIYRDYEAVHAESSDKEVIATDFDTTWMQDSECDEESGAASCGPRTGDIDEHDVVQEGKCIAYNYLILDVVKMAFGRRCSACDKRLLYNTVTKGTCLLVTWRCESNQCTNSSSSWSSQPRVKQMYACNLLVPSCLLLSGNNYSKVALFARFLNLGFVGEAYCYRCVNRLLYET